MEGFVASAYRVSSDSTQGKVSACNFVTSVQNLQYLQRHVFGTGHACPCLIKPLKWRP